MFFRLKEAEGNLNALGAHVVSVLACRASAVGWSISGRRLYSPFAQAPPRPVLPLEPLSVCSLPPIIIGSNASFFAANCAANCSAPRFHSSTRRAADQVTRAVAATEGGQPFALLAYSMWHAASSSHWWHFSAWDLEHFACLWQLHGAGNTHQPLHKCRQEHYFLIGDC